VWNILTVLKDFKLTYKIVNGVFFIQSRRALLRYFKMFLLLLLVLSMSISIAYIFLQSRVRFKISGISVNIKYSRYFKTHKLPFA
jgi:hypothetical protein